MQWRFSLTPLLASSMVGPFDPSLGQGGFFYAQNLLRCEYEPCKSFDIFFYECCECFQQFQNCKVAEHAAHSAAKV
jgi:hypothetical protein